MNQNILVYTFFKYHSITYKVLQTLDTDKKIISNKTNLEKFASEIVKQKYNLVIGLGDFMKTAKRIRIESEFINKYGRQRLKTDAPEYLSSSINIPEILPKDLYISEHTTNGPCNRSAFVIANYLNSMEAKTKIGFIHIPKHFNLQRASDIVKEVINANTSK